MHYRLIITWILRVDHMGVEYYYYINLTASTKTER